MTSEVPRRTVGGHCRRYSGALAAACLCLAGEYPICNICREKQGEVEAKMACFSQYRHRDLCRAVGIISLQVVANFADTLRTTRYLPPAMIPLFKAQAPPVNLGASSRGRETHLITNTASDVEVEETLTPPVPRKSVLPTTGLRAKRGPPTQSDRLQGSSKRPRKDQEDKSNKAREISRKLLDLSDMTFDEDSRVDPNVVPQVKSA